MAGELIAANSGALSTGADIFEISASLGLNTSGYESGLTNALKYAESKLSDFAKWQISLAWNVAKGFTESVVETGMGFDKEMSAVEAVLGKEEGTAENMLKLRSYLLEQTRYSIFTAEEGAEAYYNMGLAGWNAAQLMKGLPGIIALAAASGDDLGRTTETVVTSIAALGLEAKDVTDYVDILAATATNSVTDIGELGNAFSYAAQQAGALHIDADDLALSLGLLANQSITGSQAGTMLRTMFTRLSTNISNARDKFESLGTKVFDAQGKMRDWSTILEEARAGWAKLTDEQKQQYAYTITGMRGVSGLNALLGTTEDKYNNLKSAIDNAQGAAQRMADIKLDNLWGDIQIFNSELDHLKNILFEDINSPLREMLGWVTDSLRNITDAISEKGLEGGIEQLATEIDNLGQKFGPTLEAIGRSLGPLVAGLVDTAEEYVFPFIVDAGSSLAQGLFEGFSKETNNLMLSIITGTLANTAEGLKDGARSGIGGKAGMVLTAVNNTLFGGIADQFVYSLTGGVEGPKKMRDRIETVVDEAFKLGFGGASGGGGSTTGGGAGRWTIPFNMDEEYLNSIPDKMKTTGEAGGESFRQSMVESISGMPQEEIDKIASQAAEWSKQWGKTVGTTLDDTVGNYGADAGDAFSSNFQGELNRHTFSINVNANVSGLPAQHNASAMNTGRIFNRPTIFGYADGAYQIAGDAGAEAVVGVNSLYRMIQNAVHNSMGQTVVVPRSNGGDNLTVIVKLPDDTELGRAVYRMYNRESKRQGVQLAGVM